MLISQSNVPLPLPPLFIPLCHLRSLPPLVPPYFPCFFPCLFVLTLISSFLPSFSSFLLRLIGVIALLFCVLFHFLPLFPSFLLCLPFFALFRHSVLPIFLILLFPSSLPYYFFLLFSFLSLLSLLSTVTPFSSLCFISFFCSHLPIPPFHPSSIPSLRPVSFCPAVPSPSPPALVR